MQRVGNYEIAKKNAGEYFLKEDQNLIIEKFGLKHDARFLYLGFLGENYRVNRENANVEKLAEKKEEPCSYEEVLSIYDLLAHSDKRQHPAGEWCLVNTLPGVAQTSGLGNKFFSKYAGVLMQNEKVFVSACERAFGKCVSYGDFGFMFPLFDELSLLMRVYRADDEFPAQIDLLWDKNTLKYVHYETTYYIALVFFERLVKLCES